MMKSVLALVVLLHLCYSSKSETHLKREIIQRLGNLNKLYIREKLNITSLDTMKVPSDMMLANPASCLGIFVKELKLLLTNVTVEADEMRIVTEIGENLSSMGTLDKNNKDCPMANGKKSLKPFSPYIAFLRRLLISKKR